MLVHWLACAHILRPEPPSQARVPPAPDSCTSLGDWARSIGEERPGERLVVTCAEEFGPGEEGICQDRYEAHLVGGGLYVDNDAYELLSTTLWLPGVSPAAFWAEARRCLTVPGVRLDTLDPSAGEEGPTPPPWRWEWVDGCTHHVEIATENGGMIAETGTVC